MPLNINFQQILLHMFNFVILAFGLYMLLYKPVVAFMKKREDHFADLEKQAQEAKSQAEATLAEYNAKLAGADEEIRQKNAAAAQEADRQRQERMQRAQADADKLLKNGVKLTNRAKIPEEIQRGIYYLPINISFIEDSATDFLQKLEEDVRGN